MKQHRKLYLLVAIIGIAVLAAVLYLLLRDTEPQSNESSAEIPSLMVTFYSDDGSVILQDLVAEGEPAAAPVEPVMTPNRVFLKWDTDFSTVTKDLEIHPVCETVAEKKNVFSLAGAYGRAGDMVYIPFRLCGDVELCGFDAAVSYDTSLLSLESVYDEDGAVIYNDQLDGQILLNLVDAKNVTGDVDICWFKFTVLADRGDIPVDISITSIYSGDSEEQMTVPEYTTISGGIHIY